MEKDGGSRSYCHIRCPCRLCEFLAAVCHDRHIPLPDFFFGNRPSLSAATNAREPWGGGKRSSCCFLSLCRFRAQHLQSHTAVYTSFFKWGQYKSRHLSLYIWHSPGCSANKSSGIDVGWVCCVWWRRIFAKQCQFATIFQYITAFQMNLVLDLPTAIAPWQHYLSRSWSCMNRNSPRMLVFDA